MPPPVSVPPPLRLANRARRRRSLISLTPLIDVVFILLIFFMLASSFLNLRSIDLNAPSRAAAGSSMEGALLVEILPTGLRLSGQTVSLETLAARVRERVAQEPDRRVLVRPASGIVLQEAVNVLDRLAAAGASNLSLVRDPSR